MASLQKKIGMLCMVLGILYAPAYLKFAMSNSMETLHFPFPYITFGFAISLIVVGLGIYLTDDSEEL